MKKEICADEGSFGFILRFSVTGCRPMGRFIPDGKLDK